MTLNHEKLEVYQEALRFNVKVYAWVEAWGNRHAISDQFLRAASSVVENVAFASATRTLEKTKRIEYAIGSCAECSACMDLAAVKHLVDDSLVQSEKRNLSKQSRMLAALRKSWMNNRFMAQEEKGAYVAEINYLFYHEKLDVYRNMLDLAEGILKSARVEGLSQAHFRNIDEPLTSMLLNLAEGNARYAESEKRRFFEISMGVFRKIVRPA
jgi:four helix bundle protein